MEHSAGESDRGITLIIASHVDACLRRVLKAVLIESKETERLFEGPYAPFGSLSGKTQAAFVMGLITKREFDEINALRGVRNVFAHEADASFEHPKIAKICNKEVVNGGRMIPRDEFLHMAQNAVFPLLYRDLEVSDWRRPVNNRGQTTVFCFPQSGCWRIAPISVVRTSFNPIVRQTPEAAEDYSEHQNTVRPTHITLGDCGEGDGLKT